MIYIPLIMICALATFEFIKNKLIQKLFVSIFLILSLLNVNNLINYRTISWNAVPFWHHDKSYYGDYQINKILAQKKKYRQ